MNIVEAYQKKLAVSEKVYAKEHGGRALAENKKIAIARVLANTSEYITEAFENSVGTQFNNMKTFKKFCLDLTTVALPSLIANDLVIVYPMKSRTGYIQYLQFTAGSNKGGVKQGELFNDPFALGKMTDERVNYTGATVTDTVEDADNYRVTWTPIVHKAFENKWDVKVITNRQSVALYGTVDKEGKITINSAASGGLESIAAGDKVLYFYDNIVIPQNDIPQATAHMEDLELAAKARRIAVYYSQMAAFQAKTEMGIDLGEILATQACAELSYEIDTEVIKTLIDGANENKDADGNVEEVVFNKALPIGVSKRDHYAAFAEKIEEGSQIIYDRTQKHAANYMIASSSLKPMFVMMDGWKAASTAKINGPYFAGELNGLKVYITPAIAAGHFVLGYNGGDMVTSAAIYAPYMAIVPTQLLGFADGAMSQGFSTMYDLKLINKLLLVAGHVIDKPNEVKVTADEKNPVATKEVVVGE